MQSVIKTNSLNFSGSGSTEKGRLCEDWSFWKGKGRCVNENENNWKYRFPAVLCNNTEIDCNLTLAPLCCKGADNYGCFDFETLNKSEEFLKDYDNETYENLPSVFKKQNFANYHFCNRSKVYVQKGKHLTSKIFRF